MAIRYPGGNPYEGWFLQRLLPRYYQMKKELREQQEQVRVLRKKWSAHPAKQTKGPGSWGSSHLGGWGSPPMYKPMERSFMEGEQPSLGDLLAMVTKCYD